MLEWKEPQNRELGIMLGLPHSFAFTSFAFSHMRYDDLWRCVFSMGGEEQILLYTSGTTNQVKDEFHF
jgi:hypothetical protein